MSKPDIEIGAGVGAGRVRVMVQTPETLFVYWPEPGAEEQTVEALDADGVAAASFVSPAGGRGGYLRAHLPSVQAVRVRGAVSGEVTTVELSAETLEHLPSSDVLPVVAEHRVGYRRADEAA